MSELPIRYNEAGQPTLRVQKDLIAVGTYTPPSKAWTLQVDTDRLHKFARKFSSMQAAGVRVPIISVDAKGAHNWKPENGRGYLTGVAVQGDRLIGDIELIGQDAIALAGRTEVSVGIHPDFRDGTGNSHGEAIDHVAVCLNPVVPNQQSWRIAASRGGQADDREDLSMPAATSSEKPIMALTADQTKTLSEKLGTPVTEANLADLVIKHLSAADTVAADLTKARADLSTVTAERDTLKGQLDKAPKPIELSRDVADALTDVVGLRLDGLVTAGKITPAVKAKLAGPLAQPVLLSRGSAEKSAATLILEALAENDVVKLGEQTGGQSGKAFSRETPGGDEGTADSMVSASIARVVGKSK